MPAPLACGIAYWIAGRDRGARTVAAAIVALIRTVGAGFAPIFGASRGRVLQIDTLTPLHSRWKRV
ncbi:hypothetical protein PT2222_150168 [Paraburkholderia tropica]